MPDLHSPEALARLDLCRKLEGRLVLFETELDSTTTVRTLTTTYNWSGSHFLEQAIAEVTAVLKTAAKPTDSSGSRT